MCAFFTKKKTEQQPIHTRFADMLSDADDSDTRTSGDAGSGGNEGGVDDISACNKQFTPNLH